MESLGGAVFWGAFGAAALMIGQLLAKPLDSRERTTGLLMGFGAGTLLSAIAYELIPLTTLSDAPTVAVTFMLGALVYFGVDAVLDQAGAAQRQSLSGHDDSGSGRAMFLGALLDGVPESFILGIGLAQGGGISVAFIVAVFMSNVPEGAAGTISLRKAGVGDATITRQWGSLVVASAVSAGLGFILADELAQGGAHVEAFAGGAMLVMLADSMMPEAFRHGGRAVGLLTVVGYLVAAVLTVAA